MIHGRYALYLVLSVGFALGGTARAQEVGGDLEGPTPLPEVSPDPSLDPAVESDQYPATELPAWTYERTTGNTAGTVTNTHRGILADDGSRVLREHVVTNPRGQMVQTWERVHTDDGYVYRRSHVWTDPDGNPIRSHEWTTPGTDPQPPSPSVATTGIAPQLGDSAASAASAAKRPSWLERFNPFRRTDRSSTPRAATKLARGWGFSIGTGSPSSRGASRPSEVMNRKSPGTRAVRTGRPDWAGSRGGNPAKGPKATGPGLTASRPVTPPGLGRK